MFDRTIKRIRAAKEEFYEYGFRHIFKKIFIKLFSITGISHHFFMKINGFRLYLFPTLLTHNLFTNRKYRIDNDTVYQAYLRKGDIAIDVGANIGSATLFFANLVDSTGMVLSFEPSKIFFKYLIKNIKLNGFKNIKAYPYALGERTEKLFFNENRTDDTTYRIELSKETSGKCLVEVYPLDRFTKEYKSIRLLKIDVEGFEKFVLLGAKDTLKKTDILYIEFETKNMKDLGVTPEDLLKLISEYFDIYIAENGILQPFEFKPRIVYGVNLICLTREKIFV